MDLKGVYYTADALFAAILLAGTIILLFQSNYYEPSLDESVTQTQDVLNVLQELRVEEVSSPLLAAAIANGSIPDPTISVLDQIGQYWSQNQTSAAGQVFTAAMGSVLPEYTNIALTAQGTDIFRQAGTSVSTLASSSRLITGIEEGEAITGSTSSAYLTRVRNKKSASYVYLGGYVGQGNISVVLSLPDDFDDENFVEATLKIETPGSFDVEVNGDSCGSFSGSSTEVNNWNLTCNESFVAGDNDIEFLYTSALNTSAISGGFVRVTHTTDELKADGDEDRKRFQLPGIEGFINYYDSFDVQGVITSYNVNLTLDNVYDTFVTVGNETILYIPGSNETQVVTYTAANLSLPPQTMPLRIGTTNLSNITVSSGGEATNSFLVTDVSGSMNDCGSFFTETTEYCRYQYGSSWWGLYFWTECEYTGSCSANECGVSGWWINDYRNHFTYDQNTTSCNQTLLDIAKDADTLFVETVLGNSTLNEIGLVDYATDANTPTSLTNIEGTLTSEIDSYSAGGGTCTCCGINRAKDLLLASDDDERFMIVLSDGEPTQYCNGLSDYTGSGGDNAEARADAIASGQHACANNITVYTIGFGEAMSSQGQDVMRQTACNSSLYYNATNVQDLATIYEEIAGNILLEANYSSQTIEILGNFTTAQLSPESYIDIEYTPLVQNATPGQLSIVFETDQFNTCDATIAIPEGIEVTDAVVTSFSSNQWTKSLTVNDITIFNLTDYTSNYPTVGDPFQIQIPAILLNPGEDNDIRLEVGDSPTNSTSCSANNTLIYTGLVEAVTPRSATYEKFTGCTWEIESENDRLFSFAVPEDYAGANNCTYTSSSISYATDDAYDVATFQLLRQLDPDQNGKIIVDLQETDLEITITIVSGVPYLWGPSVVRAEVWE